MGIDDFMSKTRSKSKQFLEQSRGKSKEEVRELEQQMLKPATLPPYTKEQANTNVLADRGVKIVFPDMETFELFARHFRVRGVGKAVGNAVTDIKLLILFLEHLESGEIVYDKENGRLEFTGVEPGDNQRVAPLDGGKQRRRT